MRARYALLATILAVLAAPRPLPAAEERLTNEQVTQMVQAGLATELVVKKIKSTKSIFDDSPGALIKLKKGGVPDAVIELMLDETDKRRKELRSKINLEIQHLSADNRPEVRDAAFIFLHQLGPAALPELRKRLSHSRPEIRSAVATALGRMQDRESAADLRLMLVDNDPGVRRAAADALGRLRDELALKLARRALVAGNPPLSGYARVLGRFRDVQSTAMLRVRMLENADARTRAQAAWALGEIGNKSAAADLEHALIKDRTAEVRAEAATALGKLKVPSTARSLQLLCRRDGSPARAAALRALGEFPAAQAVPFLVEWALLRNQAKLKAEEVSSVLASLRKLTHQDLGGDPRRWRAWWLKNRARIAQTEDPAATGENDPGPPPEEQGKATPHPPPARDPAPPPPPPPAKTPGPTPPPAPAGRDKPGLIDAPQPPVPPAPAPRATGKPSPATRPAMRGRELPDTPPPVLPPLPARAPSPQPELRTGKPAPATVPPPSRKSIGANPKPHGDDPPGIFVPKRKDNQQGMKPAARPSANEADDPWRLAHARQAPAGAPLPEAADDLEANPGEVSEPLAYIPGIMEITSAPRRKPRPASKEKRILLAVAGGEKPRDAYADNARTTPANADPAPAPGRGTVGSGPDRAVEHRSEEPRTHPARPPASAYARKAEPERTVFATAAGEKVSAAPDPVDPEQRRRSATLLQQEVAAMHGDGAGGGQQRNRIQNLPGKGGGDANKPGKKNIPASPAGRVRGKGILRTIFGLRPPTAGKSGRARFSSDTYDQE